MRRKTIKRWTRACLLGSAVAIGCSQFRTGIDDSPPVTAHVVPRPPIAPIIPAQPARALAQPQLARSGPLPAALPPVAPAVAAPSNEAPISQANFENSKPSLADQPGPARGAPVTTAAVPGFSHSTDYTELTGQIQRFRINRGWRLRYASVDDVDPYGGSVTLIGDGKLSGLKDGDLVRVHGRLVNPDQTGIAPPYEVDAIQAVDKNP